MTPVLPLPPPSRVDCRTSTPLGVYGAHWLGVASTPVPAGWALRT